MLERRRPTVAWLISCGAAPHEAAEVVDALWSEHLVGDEERPALLRRYNGECALQTWFNTVAANRWISAKRTELRRRRLLADEPEAEDAPGDADAPLLGLMRAAIESAFAACPAEHFVMLQLAHFDEVSGVDLAVMFQCTEGAISKALDRAGKAIETAILREVKRRDPWLDLQWADFLELCRVATPACFGAS